MIMNVNKFLALSISTAALGLLGACGGGGGTTVTAFASFTDTSSQQTSALAAASLDSGARTTTGLTGTLNRADDTASIGTLSGAINANRSEITLSDGGKVVLLSGDNDYSSRYVATPTIGNGTIGIVGAVTPIGSLPTGAATFNGPATVTIQDRTVIYDLTGSTAIAANFGTDNVTTTISALDGTRTEVLMTPTNVTDVATITITDSTISGATFSGGTAAITDTSLSVLSASHTSSTSGAFFGPTGQEAGGVLVIDDTDTGNIRVFGDFIGK